MIYRLVTTCRISEGTIYYENFVSLAALKAFMISDSSAQRVSNRVVAIIFKRLTGRADGNLNDNPLSRYRLAVDRAFLSWFSRRRGHISPSWSLHSASNSSTCSPFHRRPSTQEFLFHNQKSDLSSILIHSWRRYRPWRPLVVED